jgi:acetyl-CoA C-acetyltransferase
MPTGAGAGHAIWGDQISMATDWMAFGVPKARTAWIERLLMTAERQAWIIDGVRTPRAVGKPSGALHRIHPQELMAQCLNALIARTVVGPEQVDDVVVGNGNPLGDQAHGIGRLSVLTAGWPYQTPGFTLNRHCGSAQTAVTLAAMGVISGMQDLVVAGGVESMSRWPGGEPPTRDGYNPRLRQRYETVPGGISGDLVATVEGFTREQCDRLAVVSQDRAAVAIAEGRFDRSVIVVRDADGNVALDHEEIPHPDTTLETLAQMTPSFTALGTQQFDGYDGTFDEISARTYPQIDHVEHVHHPGNSAGVADGASALLIASSDYARAHGLTPRARIISSVAVGSEPVIMLTGPAPASKKVLEKAGMKVGDIDLWEINEAFAAVVLKASRDLDLDMDRVNVNGGAMALGHPIGATGGMLIETAIDELERSDRSTALITMCTGGGMGTATIIQRV